MASAVSSVGSVVPTSFSSLLTARVQNFLSTLETLMKDSHDFGVDGSNVDVEIPAVSNLGHPALYRSWTLPGEVKDLGILPDGRVRESHWTEGKHCFSHVSTQLILGIDLGPASSHGIEGKEKEQHQGGAVELYSPFFISSTDDEGAIVYSVQRFACSPCPAFDASRQRPCQDDIHSKTFRRKKHLRGTRTKYASVGHQRWPIRCMRTRATILVAFAMSECVHAFLSQAHSVALYRSFLPSSGQGNLELQAIVPGSAIAVGADSEGFPLFLKPAAEGTDRYAAPVWLVCWVEKLISVLLWVCRFPPANLCRYLYPRGSLPTTRAKTNSQRISSASRLIPSSSDVHVEGAATPTSRGRADSKDDFAPELPTLKRPKSTIRLELSGASEVDDTTIVPSLPLPFVGSLYADPPAVYRTEPAPPLPKTASMRKAKSFVKKDSVPAILEEPTSPVPSLKLPKFSFSNITSIAEDETLDSPSDKPFEGRPIVSLLENEEENDGEADGQVNVRVVLRCRPMLSTDRERGAKPILTCNRNEVHVRRYSNYASTKSYLFHQVHGPTTSQYGLFQESVLPIVTKVSLSLLRLGTPPSK